MYVTVTAFQCMTLFRSDGTNPLIPGPVFFHFHLSEETYTEMFNFLSSKLGSIRLVIGSDEELALRNALKRAFPLSLLILCVLHLKKNALRHVKGVSKSARDEIERRIFGNHGLTSSMSMDQFEQKKSFIDSDAFESIEYFESLCLRIQNGVVLPRIECPHIPRNWKNNSCESINHILKLEIDWKPNRLPSLLEKLHGYETKVKNLMIASFYGIGEFILHPKLRKRFLINVAKWATMTEVEKSKHFEKFIETPVPAPDEFVTSKDNLLNLPKVDPSKKKPHQQVRSPRNVRTKSRKRTASQSAVPPKFPKLD